MRPCSNDTRLEHASLKWNPQRCRYSVPSFPPITDQEAQQSSLCLLNPTTQDIGILAQAILLLANYLVRLYVSHCCFILQNHHPRGCLPIILLECVDTLGCYFPFAMLCRISYFIGVSVCASTSCRPCGILSLTFIRLDDYQYPLSFDRIVC